MNISITTHAVPDTPRTCSSYNWKFISLDWHLPISSNFLPLSLPPFLHLYWGLNPESHTHQAKCYTTKLHSRPYPPFFHHIWWVCSLNSGLELVHASSTFYSGYFGNGVSSVICLGWPQSAILLISSSQVARITGMSHR
jgi:hypothetical protein